MYRKKFLFQIFSSRHCINGGRNQRCRIYQLKKDDMFLLGITSWNTAGYYGKHTEVFQWLLKAGYIPKKWIKSSECYGHAEGYYQGEVCNIYLIKEIDE